MCGRVRYSRLADSFCLVRVEVPLADRIEQRYDRNQRHQPEDDPNEQQR